MKYNHKSIKIDSEGNETMREIDYTNTNGYCCSDSLSSNKETAKRLFDLVVKHNGELKTTTVLETIEN